jgi:flotillin
MFEVSSQMMVVGGSILGTLFTGLTTVTVVSRFYRRCGADEALVRTGAGGNKVVIGGGILVYPILHQLLRVSLRSVKLSVERSGKNALVTADKIKANVTTELYIKVEPIAEDVLAAARSFGERNLDEHAIGDLIEGKLTDALRSVAANQTFMSLHGKRKEFAEHIQAALSEELKKNGLTLENVSITALAMVPVKDLDEHDVFDAEGLRAITESVQTNREKTNQIQRDKDNQIHAANVAARMRQLELEQNQKRAEADQGRKVAEYAATQQAETAKAVYIQEQAREIASYEKQREVERGRIEQEQAIAVAMAGKQRAEREANIAAEKGQQAAEIEKQRVIEAAMIEKETVVQAKEIERQRALEVASIEKVIAVTRSEEEKARASALKALARAEEERAMQAIITVEETAKAERDKQIAVIRAEAEAEVKRAMGAGEAAKATGLAEAALAKVRGEAQARVETAEKEAEALERLAQATVVRGAAEADARRKMIEAENEVAMKFILRDVALKAIETMPDLARELMEPAKAITEIKVLQTGGMGGGATGAQISGNQPMGMMSPILKTILEAGAAYPLLRELMSFAQVDGSKLTAKARGALAELGGEIDTVMNEQKELPPAAANETHDRAAE